MLLSLPLPTSRRRQRSSAPSFPRRRAAFYFVNPKAEVRVWTRRAHARRRALLDALAHSERRGAWREQRLPRSSFHGFIPRRSFRQRPLPSLAAGLSWSIFFCVCCLFFPRELNTMWPCRGSDCCPLWEYLTDPGEKGLKNGQTSVKAW